jgi:hypothetical protein
MGNREAAIQAEIMGDGNFYVPDRPGRQVPQGELNVANLICCGNGTFG